MKKYLPIFILFITGIRCYSQEELPDVHIITTNFDRIEIIRMKSATDLLSGLNESVQKRNKKNAVILKGMMDLP